MEKKICVGCGKEIEENEVSYELPNGNYICEECFNDDYFVCDKCGEIHHTNDMIMIEDTDESVCEDCANKHYYQCCECGDYFESATNVQGDYYCEDCFDDYCGVCDDCGGYFNLNDLYEHDGYRYCENCRPNYGVISDYHDHPNDLEFFGDNHNNTVPFMGFELEVDSEDDISFNEKEGCAKAIQDKFENNFIYFEEDGSLNNGFENITQPATLEYHYSIKDKYNEAMRYIVKSGYRSHNTQTCGLHIHFNRNFFGKDEELCLTRLLYLVEKFWDELVIFSRRSMSTLERWAKKNTKTPEETVNEWKSGNCFERYQAVNLTNSNTIEFRMFRGTLNIETLMATLQLCHVLVMTAKNTSSVDDIQNITWESLLQYDEMKSYWERAKNRNVTRMGDNNNT